MIELVDMDTAKSIFLYHPSASYQTFIEDHKEVYSQVVSELLIGGVDAFDFINTQPLITKEVVKRLCDSYGYVCPDIESITINEDFIYIDKYDRPPLLEQIDIVNLKAMVEMRDRFLGGDIFAKLCENDGTISCLRKHGIINKTEPQ